MALGSSFRGASALAWTFWIADLPTTIGVTLAVRLLAMAEELGEEHEHTAIIGFGTRMAT